MMPDPAAAPLLQRPQISPFQIPIPGGPPPPNYHAINDTTHHAAPPPPLSGLQRFAITTFAVLRIARGIGFVAWPALSLASLDMPPTASAGNAFMLGSLLGVRDLLLGGLLYTADAYQEREIRRALLVNLLSDACDTFILIFSTACSAHWQINHILAIAFVAVLALMEHLTLFTMNDDEELIERHALGGGGGGGAYQYQVMMEVDEDRKRRMDSWLAELRNAETERSVTPVPRDHSIV